MLPEERFEGCLSDYLNANHSQNSILSIGINGSSLCSLKKLLEQSTSAVIKDLINFNFCRNLFSCNQKDEKANQRNLTSSYHCVHCLVSLNLWNHQKISLGTHEQNIKFPVARSSSPKLLGAISLATHWACIIY